MMMRVDILALLGLLVGLGTWVYPNFFAEEKPAQTELVLPEASQLQPQPQPQQAQIVQQQPAQAQIAQQTVIQAENRQTTLIVKGDQTIEGSLVFGDYIEY